MLTDKLFPDVHACLILDAALSARSQTVSVSELCVRAIQPHSDRVVQSAVLFHEL